MGAEQSGNESAKLLASWVNAIADWADRMPLRNVCIFCDHARGEAAPAGKLKIAIEYDGNVSDHIMRRWQRENATDFAELKKALGIDTELFTDQDDHVWPAIRDAAVSAAGSARISDWASAIPKEKRPARAV